VRLVSETYTRSAKERFSGSFICGRGKYSAHLFSGFYLLCANRIFALRLHRPISFGATISLPNPQEESDSGLIYGFMELLKLFIAVGDKFYSYWNNENHEVQPQWLDETIQTITNMIPTQVEYLQTLTVDIYITRQWLRVNIWKLQTRSSRDHNRAVRFKALVDICQELVEQLRTYNPASLELHGLDLVITIYCSLLT
jgi:hypothetical protein